jgi:hypothetical protein
MRIASLLPEAITRIMGYCERLSLIGYPLQVRSGIEDK